MMPNKFSPQNNLDEEYDLLKPLLPCYLGLLTIENATSMISEIMAPEAN